MPLKQTMLSFNPVPVYLLSKLENISKNIPSMKDDNSKVSQGKSDNALINGCSRG